MNPIGQNIINSMPNEIFFKFGVLEADYISKCRLVCKNWKMRIDSALSDVFADYERMKGKLQDIYTLMLLRPIPSDRIDLKALYIYQSITQETKLLEGQEQLTKSQISDRLPLHPKRMEVLASWNQAVNLNRFFSALVKSFPVPHLNTFHQSIANVKNAEDRAAAIRKWMKLYNNPVLLLAVNVIQLTNLGLTQFPIELFQLKRLTKIEADSNNIKVIPPAIQTLKSLLYLDLSNNQLKVVDPSIVQLTSLAILRLNYNRLEKIPEQLGLLKKLYELRLSHNQLKNLPASIGKLSELRMLFIEMNPLDKLPNEIFNSSNKAISSNPIVVLNRACHPEKEFSEKLKESLCKLLSFSQSKR